MQLFLSPVFLSPEKEKLRKRKSCKGDAPLTPAVGRDTTTAWEAVGRLQYRPHNADRSEFRLLNILPRTPRAAGSCRAARRLTLFARIQKLSPLCTLSLSVTAPGLPVLRGVSGGGDALSSLCRRPFLRRHNESHFAAQSPERSFFFPLFLSPRKKKRLLATTQSQNLCRQNKTRLQSPLKILPRRPCRPA